MGHRRGVTLIELAVTLAIISLIGLAAFSAIRQAKVRNSFNSTVSSLQVGLRKLKATAWGNGFDTVFVVNKATGEYWGIEDRADTFSLSTFDATDPAPSPNVLLFSGTLSSSIAFGPSTGYSSGTLPRPFASVHAASACTFCVTTPANYGAITFTPEGTASFTGSYASDGSFSIETRNDAGGYSYTTIGVIGLTGSIETFEGTHS